jgi:hypothetical protein
MCYQGGNFAYCYHWQEGIGPLEKRPVRRELTWQSRGPITFGTDEYIRLCKKMDCMPPAGGDREIMDLLDKSYKSQMYMTVRRFAVGFTWGHFTWLPGLAFAVWTFANLAPRARSHHAWYYTNFPEYPKNRKALIPWIW